MKLTCERQQGLPDPTTLLYPALRPTRKDGRRDRYVWDALTSYHLFTVHDVIEYCAMTMSRRQARELTYAALSNQRSFRLEPPK